MVGIVIISHSAKVAEGVMEMAKQMAEDVKIASAGGTDDGRIGTDINKIIAGIDEVYSDDGVLVFYDLGSAMMNAEMALDFIDEARKEKVILVDSALVEGVITASVYANMNMDINEILKELESTKLNKRG